MIDAIDDVRAILDEEHDFGGAGEVEKSNHMRELMEAERFLEKYVVEDSGDADAIVLLARIASRMEQWDVAVVRWSRVTRESPRYSDEAFRELGVAYRKMGSLPRARRALNKVSPGIMVKELKRERREIAARETEAAARVVGNKAIEALAEGGERATAAALVKSVISLKSVEQHVAECIGNVTAGIGAGPARRRVGRLFREGPLRVRPHSATSRAVFFCGFGWSGSGALFDYYTQADLAARPFGRSEILAFERYWSAMKVLDQIKKDEETARYALVNFIFQSVLGVGGPMSLESERSRRKSIINYFRRDRHLTEAVASASVSLFHEVLEAAKTARHDDVEAAFRSFFDYLLVAKVGPDRIGMMANCIHAENVGLVRLVSGAKAVVVFRDPRDQYVAQVYEHRGRDQMSCDEFVRDMRRRYEKYQESLELIGATNTVMSVQFEDFILSDNVRHDLATKLGLVAGSIDEDRLEYHPRDSIKNIGIYRSFSNVAEIKRIENELSDLLFDDEQG